MVFIGLFTIILVILHNIFSGFRENYTGSGQFAHEMHTQSEFLPLSNVKMSLQAQK